MTCITFFADSLMKFCASFLLFTIEQFSRSVGLGRLGSASKKIIREAGPPGRFDIPIAFFDVPSSLTNLYCETPQFYFQLTRVPFHLFLSGATACPT